MIRQPRWARAREPRRDAAFRVAIPSAPARHLVLVAVDVVDQRLLELCGHAVSQPGAGVEAVCVTDDVESCRGAVDRWCRLHASDVPVDVVDAEHQTVADAIRARVQCSLDSGWDHVTVLVPHLVLGWPWSLLHNQTSNAITRSLRRTPHVDVVRVPVGLGIDVPRRA